MADFIFLGSKITADGDCSHKFKIFALWKKSYDQHTQHIKKRRHYFADKVSSSQSFGFSSICVWIWELDYEESWEPKNWCFWLVMLENTLKCPLDCKEIQPVLKEISPDYSLEGLMLKLKLQYFGHLMRRIDSFEKTLMLGNSEGRRRWEDRGWDGWMASPTQWTWVWVSPRRWWWTGRPVVLKSMDHKEWGTTE